MLTYLYINFGILIKHKILVVGDLMIGHYLWGSVNRILSEALVQIVDIQRETNVLGGAGNVVSNLNILGCDVSLISVVGDDLIAQESKENISQVSPR